MQTIVRRIPCAWMGVAIQYAGGIGYPNVRAIFYTSIVIMIGFSVLVLSNFLQTIYFDLLTVMAIFMALTANLLLLLRLIPWARPFRT